MCFLFKNLFPEITYDIYLCLRWPVDRFAGCWIRVKCFTWLVESLYVSSQVRDWSVICNLTLTIKRKVCLILHLSDILIRDFHLRIPNKSHEKTRIGTYCCSQNYLLKWTQRFDQKGPRQANSMYKRTEHFITHHTWATLSSDDPIIRRNIREEKKQVSIIQQKA